MVERYINEDLGDFLTFIFLVVCLVWTVAVILVNVTDVANSLPIFSLGIVPLNIAISYVLWMVGGLLLILVFDWVFRILSKEINNRKEV